FTPILKPRTVEQGQADRCEAAVPAQAGLGYPLEAPGRGTNTRPRHVLGNFLFTGRRGGDRAMTTRQYARLVAAWTTSVGLDPKLFGPPRLRRTKATLIYRRTGNLRAVQLLLGHNKIESTVRYLGIEVDDALAIAEQVDV